MSEELLEQKEWTVQEYLALFDPQSMDYRYVEERSVRLKSIVVKKLKGPGGTLFEDTTFEEHSGISYTVRARL